MACRHRVARARSSRRAWWCSGPAGTVLLVHRPRYDDWSFPKGKLDRGEHATAAAVREVEEETGVHVRLGVPLADQRYPIRAGIKPVHYWIGRAVGDDDVERLRSRTPRSTRSAGSRSTRPGGGSRYEYDVRHPRRGARARAARPGPSSCSGTPGALPQGLAGRRPGAAAARDRPAARHQAGAGAGGLRRTPARQLQQHPLRADPRAVRRRDRPAAAHRRPAQRGGRHPARRPTAGDRAGRRPRRPAASAGAWCCAPTGRCCPGSSRPLGIEDPELATGEMVVLHLRKGRVRVSERHRIG